MAKRARKAKKNSKKASLSSRFFTKVKSIIFSSQGFPLFLAFTTLAILFVVFRMKNLDEDYKRIEVNKKLDKVVIENKQLKADRAKLMSVKRLRQLSKKYNLNEPKDNQVIVVP